MIFLYRKSISKGEKRTVVISFIIAAVISSIVTLFAGLQAFPPVAVIIGFIPVLIIVGLSYLIASKVAKK